jgi:hypothetical protein
LKFKNKKDPNTLKKIGNAIGKTSVNSKLIAISVPRKGA